MASASLCELMARIPSVVESILLLLDPSDLKSARLVCRKWDNFIKAQLWGRGKRGRKQLEKRLERRWKQVMPWRREIQIVEGDIELKVRSVCCNDLKMAVFVENQYGDQYWRLYNLVDLSLEYQIQTNNMANLAMVSGLRTDMGHDILAVGYFIRGMGMTQYAINAWRTVSYTHLTLPTKA